jgi:hypothetical protein
MDADKKIEDLILAGAVEVSGLDATTGEFLYSFTEKIYEVDPDIARESLELFNSYIYDLWEKGFLKMDIHSANPTISLLDKSFIEEEVLSLPRDSQAVLRSVIEALRL